MMQHQMARNLRFASSLAALSAGPHCRPSQSHSLHHFPSHSTSPVSLQLFYKRSQLCQTSQIAYFTTKNRGEELDEQGQQKTFCSAFSRQFCSSSFKQGGLAKGQPKGKILDRKYVEINHRAKLLLSMKDTQNGIRIIGIGTKYARGNPKYTHGLNVIFPRDANKLVRTLDKLMVAFEKKHQRSRQQTTADSTKPIADARLADNVIVAEEFDGETSKFELQLFYQNDILRYQIIEKRNNASKNFSVSATNLLGFRMALANLLEEFGCSHKLDMPQIDHTSPLAFGISRLFCSSSTSNSSEGELEKQKEQQGKEMEKDDGLADGEGKSFELIATKFIEIDPLHELTVRLDKMTDGQLLFNIYVAWKESEDNLVFKWKFAHGPRIHIPEAYNIVRALDKLMEALVEEDRRERSQEVNPKSVDGLLADNNIIASEEFDGQFYEFELQLYYQKEFPRYRILASPKNPDWMKRELSLPAQTMFGFREVLAGILMKYDGSQRLEMPKLNLD